MNLPNLPTDNLYKFIALSGLVLSIFFTTLLVYQEKEYFKVQTDAELRFKVYAQKLKMLEAFKVAHEGSVKALLESPNEKLLEGLMQRTNDQFFEQLDALMAEFREDSQVYVETATNRAMMEAWNWPLRAGIDTGGAIAIVGFLLWYFKLQRHQDEIVRNEAAKSRLPQTLVKTDRAPETLADPASIDICPKKEAEQRHQS